MSGGPFRPRGEAAEQPPPPEPPPARSKPKPPGPPAGIASNATWILGIFVVLALTYITINTLRADKPGSRGVAVGERMPAFAVPLATSGLDKDANVDIKRACAVRDRRGFTSCSLTAHGPAVLAFLATRSDRCIRQVDLLDRLQARFPDVRFAAIAIRADLDDLAELVRKHRWTLPVGNDRDGAVANSYAVAVCPTITFARQGGTVKDTTLGQATEAQIVREVEALR